LGKKKGQKKSPKNKQTHKNPKNVKNENLAPPPPPVFQHYSWQVLKSE